MKWKDVEGNDCVLRYTDVERMRNSQRKVRINNYGAQNLNPRNPICEKECQTGPP